MGKELDDICTSCPYIDAVKRHKQQLGAIEEYTKWLKKNHGHLIFSVPAVYPHSQYIFPQKQQLPFTPGGTHCPEPDVTLRDLTLSRATTVIMPSPHSGDGQFYCCSPTNENTSPPEDTPDNTPAGGNTGQAEKTRNAGLTPIPEKRSGMPRNICGLPWVFHRNRRLPVPEKSRCAPCIRIISTVKLYGSAPVTC